MFSGYFKKILFIFTIVAIASIVYSFNNTIISQWSFTSFAQIQTNDTIQ
jgi:hypothetical protein